MELRALKNLISEAELILSTTILPENRSKRALELLRAAHALTDDLIGQAKLTPAAILGRKGGIAVAQRGSEYFRQLAAKRKIHGGGRPKSSDQA